MTKIHLTKKYVEELMKVKGNTRGLVINTCGEYILKERGEKGLVKVEKKLAELGCELNLRKIPTFKWMPVSYTVLIFLVIMEVFNSDESIIFDLGYKGPINSLVAKSMISFFITLENALKNTNKYWPRYSDIGELNTVKYSMDKKYAVLQHRNLNKFHPVLYEYFRGYFTRIVEILSNSQNVKVEQKKSLYKGDSYDEYKISWK